MSGREAKFCLDRNQVRWVLLEGNINRKSKDDDPDKGINLAVEKIQSIQKTQIERRHKNPVAAPAALAGLCFLALSGWIARSHLWLGLPGLLVGGFVFLWGLLRLSGTAEKIDAFQIVAPGTNPEDWYIVGSHLEVTGFVEGVQKEMEAARHATKR